MILPLFDQVDCKFFEYCGNTKKKGARFCISCSEIKKTVTNGFGRVSGNEILIINQVVEKIKEKNVS